MLSIHIIILDRAQEREVSVIGRDYCLGGHEALAHEARPGTPSVGPHLIETNDTKTLDEHLAEVRPAIFAHCYRLVGSVEDAEDLTQDALLKMAENYDRFEGRSQFRTWAYRIATNTCYNYLQSARKRREFAVAEPLLTTDEFIASIDPESAAEAVQESLEFSFICVLQELSPLQRLVVVLRDVLGWSVNETAEALGSDASPIKNVHSRARKRLKELRPRGKPIPASHPQAESFMQEYARAHVEQDIDTCLGFYDSRSVVYQFPTKRFAGRREIAELYEMVRGKMPALFVGVKMNGSLGAACYHPTDDEHLQQTGVIIIELRKPRLSTRPSAVYEAFWAFQPEHFKHTKLPDRLNSRAQAAEVGRIL